MVPKLPDEGKGDGIESLPPSDVAEKKYNQNFIRCNR